mmetsp:Transcript_29588/g.64324  ORF Transcript_29588/g.64324 Transcript_29588/m.64324 type:complete len:250 (-) Transcript_29588:327-1076(-)
MSLIISVRLSEPGRYAKKEGHCYSQHVDEVMTKAKEGFAVGADHKSQDHLPCKGDVEKELDEQGDAIFERRIWYRLHNTYSCTENDPSSPSLHDMPAMLEGIRLFQQLPDLYRMLAALSSPILLFFHELIPEASSLPGGFRTTRLPGLMLVVRRSLRDLATCVHRVTSRANAWNRFPIQSGWPGLRSIWNCDFRFRLISLRQDLRGYPPKCRKRTRCARQPCAPGTKDGVAAGQLRSQRCMCCLLRGSV